MLLAEERAGREKDAVAFKEQIEALESELERVKRDTRRLGQRVEDLHGAAFRKAHSIEMVHAS